jgi:hypothetical protein
MTDTLQWICLIIGFLLFIPFLDKLRWTLLGWDKPNELLTNKTIIILGLFGFVFILLYLFLTYYKTPELR